MAGGEALKKFYAVARGRKTGIFTRLDDFQRAMRGVKSPLGKGFNSRQAAEDWLKANQPQRPKGIVVSDTTVADLERLLKKEYAFTLSLPDDLVIYTDASYENVAGVGYAGLASSIYTKDGTCVFEMTSAVADVGMSSQQAEALAIISPLLHIEGSKSIQIYSDCQALSVMLARGKVPVEHPIYYLLMRLIDLHGAQLSWVKGHAKNLSNNHVDLLAKVARRHVIEMKEEAARRRKAMKKPRTVGARLRSVFRFAWKLLFHCI